MFVTKNVPLQLQFDLPNRLAAMVHNVNINVDAGAADPDLPMQTGCDFNDIYGSVTSFDPFV